jgi:uncharacterized membrane protein YcjF (UPF0283 family)
MIAAIIPWFPLLMTAVVVYALVRKIVVERRLAALSRRQAHRRKQEEDAEYFKEVKAAVEKFDP